jgi:hypothetical protein
MNIKIGEYDVHESGTVIGLIDEPITFAIANLNFEFKFQDDKEKKEQKVNTEIAPDGTKLILNFTNFNNSLGTGNISPMKVGNINKRELLLSYRVYNLTDSSGKMLHYTWLLGSNINDTKDEQ